VKPDKFRLLKIFFEVWFCYFSACFIVILLIGEWHIFSNSSLTVLGCIAGVSPVLAKTTAEYYGKRNSIVFERRFFDVPFLISIVIGVLATLCAIVFFH